MLAAKHIEKELRRSVGDLLHIEPTDHGRFRVDAPFYFDDGDALAIYLSHENGAWMLSDAGHTLMHLSIRGNAEDFTTGTRADIIAGILRQFGVENRGGVLRLRLDESAMGQRFFDFAHAIISVSNVSFLDRETVRTTFRDDVANILRVTLSPKRVQEDWYAASDTAKLYPVDIHVNHRPTPLLVFAISSEYAIQKATIALQHFRAEKMQFDSLGVFDERAKIAGPARERFAVVCPTSFLGPMKHKTEFERLVLEMAGTGDE